MMVYAFIFYTFKLSCPILLTLIIVFLLISLCAWSFSNSNNKISINYKYLSYGLLSSLVLLIHKICYWLTITEFNNILSIILALAFIIFMLIAFSKNFTIRNFVISTLISVFIAQLIFPSFLILYTFLFLPSINNPLAYKYVLLHELTPNEASSLPSAIPSDSTNIIFYFNKSYRDGGYYSLELEFDSNTIETNNHHSKYYIKSNNDDD